MPGPLEGVKVVELGMWVAGPACAGILADWGADVVKLEPPGIGDPARTYQALFGEVMPDNPVFEMDNRSKRSIAVDLRVPEGQALALELIDDADVFVTNLRRGALERWGLGPDALLERNPRLVYQLITGYGMEGPDAARPAYDIGGFWARSGAADAHSVNGEPPLLRGAYGDHTTSMALVAGINAALVARGRTGRGRHVATSLLRTGMYVVGQDVTYLQRIGRWYPFGRTEATNVLFNCYRTGDDRWLWLLALQPDRHWPNLAVAVGRPEWLADERYETHAVRREHTDELRGELDAIFATHTLAEWGAILDDAGMWWEPVLTVEEAVAQEQAQAMDVLVSVDGPDGPMVSAASPVDFDGRSRMQSRGVPALGEHSREVLRELGYTDPEIDDLT